MTASSALKWWLLAIAGLLVAIAVAIAASQLTSQRIGLASESLRAGEELAPAAGRDRSGTGRGRDGQRHGGAPTTTTTPPPTTTTTTATSSGSSGGDDSGGGEDVEAEDD